MPYQREPHFLEKHPEYMRKYNELLKEIRVWNSCGQYWLGQEASRRAKCLLHGNVEDYEKQTHSHELTYPQILGRFN